MLDQNSPLRLPYKNVEGIDIHSDVYLPFHRMEEPKNGLCPVLLMIHGGAFILGSASMCSRDQIDDCTSRGWIVVCAEHRLCPGVNILEGPMTDIRDALRWIQDGGLAAGIKTKQNGIKPDSDRIVAMGTSSGGHLALSLAFDTVKPPIAILDFYGAKNFSHPFWTQSIEQIRSILPQASDPSMFSTLYHERTTTQGGLSLEGQVQAGPDFSDPRTFFAMTCIGNGTLLKHIWPIKTESLKIIDPMENVSSRWPPTCIVHGDADFMIPIELSRKFEERLKDAGVESEFVEVQGEPHTFVGKMVKGSPTWNSQRKGFDFLERVIQRSYV